MADIEFEVDTDLAYRLAEDFAGRHAGVLAGTEKERAFAEEIRAALASYGVPVEIHRFFGMVSTPGDGELRIIGSDGAASEPINCQVFAQSEPADALEAEVVFISAGGIDDYVDVDVRGKIVIVNLSYSPPRPEKVRIAVANGAAGIIMVNWGKDTDRAIPNGTVKHVWGNPTRETIDAMRTLPALGIARPDGVRLIAQAQSPEGLRVRLSAQVDRAWRELHMPVAWVGAGRDSGRQFVMAGGHFDNWGGGVTDNIAGNTGLIALARALHDQRDALQRDVVIPFWTGHENGIMIGSTWYADRFWHEIKERCVAYFSMAQIGLRGYSLWTAHSAGELRRLVRTVNAPEHALVDRPEKTGDQSFYGIGIPAMDARTGPTDEEKAAGHGGILGWWYHSDADRIENLDPALYASDLNRISGYVYAIAAADVLPFSVADAADEILERLAEIRAEVDGTRAVEPAYGFLELVELAERLADRSRVFDEWALSISGDGRLHRANDAIVAFSRHTVPIRYAAESSPYRQDSYGESRLKHSLPELQAYLDLAVAYDGDQVHLLTGEVLRARNRMKDALVGATRVLDAALQAR